MECILTDHRGTYAHARLDKGLPVACYRRSKDLKDLERRVIEKYQHNLKPDHIEQARELLSDQQYRIIHEQCFLVHPELPIIKTIDGIFRDMHFKPLKSRKARGGYINYIYNGKSYRGHTLTTDMIHFSTDTEGWVTDHLNGQRDDNRSQNLNLISRSLNGRNRVKGNIRFAKYREHQYRWVHQKDINGTFYSQYNTRHIDDLYQRTNQPTARCFKRLINQKRNKSQLDHLACTIDIYDSNDPVYASFISDYVMYQLYGDKIRLNYDLQDYGCGAMDYLFCENIHDAITKWGQDIHDYMVREYRMLVPIARS